MIDVDNFDFDSCTPESLKADAKSKILETLQAGGLEIDTREGSYTDALLSEAAYMVYQALMTAPDLMAAAVPAADGGSHLDSFGSIFGVVRSPGTRASVTITFTGTDNTVIPEGTWVVADSGERYRTLASATITGGTASVEAEAEQVGLAYNVDAGAISRLQTTIAGITAVTNAAAATGGSDVESDRSLYERIHTLLSEPVASGNVNNYKQWARECSGVGYVAVIPLWDGNGTVKVILAGEDKLPVGEPIITDVEAHIEAERPIGADVTVVSVSALTITVTASVTLDESTSEETVEADMEAALQQLFDSMTVGAGETIRYNRVMALLLSLPGVVDCGSMTLNGSTNNVVLTSEQVPQLGTVTITEGST